MLRPVDLRGAVTLKSRIDINEFGANHSNCKLMCGIMWFSKATTSLCSGDAWEIAPVDRVRRKEKWPGEVGSMPGQVSVIALKRDPGEHTAEEVLMARPCSERRPPLCQGKTQGPNR